MATWKKVLTEAQIDTDILFGSASDALVPSQLAVKTYVDAQVDTADSLAELGDVDASSASDGHVIIYNNPEWVSTEVTGDISINASGVTAIGNDKVTYAKMQDIGTANRVLGKTSTGTIEEVQVAHDMIANNAVDGDKLSDNIDIAGTLDVTGTATFDANVAILGKLTMTGDIDTVSVTDLDVADKTITLASSSSSYADQATMLTATNGGGISLQNQYTSGSASTSADAMSASFTWDKDAGLSGWKAKNYTDVSAVPVALMDFKSDTGAPANTVSSGGVGSFILNTHDDELYVRVG